MIGPTNPAGITLGEQLRVVLQGSDVEVTLYTGWFVFLVTAATVLLGLYISYQAYRGYRRNRSRPMLFLAAGLMLLTFVPAVFSTAAANVEGTRSAGLVLSSMSRLVGLVSILYGIKYA
jgi:Kef-type K+ transport system membrane component KefB